MKLYIQPWSFTVLVLFLALGVFAHALPGLTVRDPAAAQTPDVPQVGQMAQSAGTVIASITAPGTDTTVTFSRFSSPAPDQVTQSDSLTCVVEALQEIYSEQYRYGISTRLSRPWVYSGSQPKNQECLMMQNEDERDHILTWGIVVESLRAVVLGLGNTTFSSCQFDVYNNKRWGHLGYGSLGMQTGEGAVAPPAIVTS